MYEEILLADPNSDGSIKLNKKKLFKSKMRLINLFAKTENRNKNYVLKHLGDFIADNCPESTIVGLNDAIKITYKEVDKFTIIQLFFEKSKIALRHNLKSFDHIVMPEPNLGFIDAILNEIKQLGFLQLSRFDDELHSTCRIEFIKGK